MNDYVCNKYTVPGTVWYHRNTATPTTCTQLCDDATFFRPDTATVKFWLTFFVGFSPKVAFGTPVTVFSRSGICACHCTVSLYVSTLSPLIVMMPQSGPLLNIRAAPMALAGTVKLTLALGTSQYLR